jgi:hypothetical protein
VPWGVDVHGWRAAKRRGAAWSRTPWEAAAPSRRRGGRGKGLAAAVRGREDGVGRKGAGQVGCHLKRRLLQPLVDMGGGLQSSAHDSLLAGGGRTTLDAQFWHFLFGFGPGSLQNICSLMYTLQIVYRD